MTVTTWKKGQKDGKTVTLKKHFNKWFNKEGGFVVLPFQQMIASGVEVVGKMDPTKVVEAKKKVVRIEDAGKSMDDKWASLLAESSGVSVEETATPSKGKKRSKKAA